MRIGFDGKRATQNLTGLGNYSRYIIRLLVKFHPQNEYCIYALQKPGAELEIAGAEYNYPKKNAIKSYWRTFGLVKTLGENKIDLFHGLSNEIPYGLKKAGIPSVVTIHDLIFIRYPQYYSAINRFVYKIKFSRAALKADKIIAISKQTKEDIVKYLGVKEDRIEVIYQNCDPIFQEVIAPDDKRAIVEKYRLPEKYLLNVGTIEERKNLMLIVKSLRQIDDVHLVVVGRETKYIRAVRDYINQNKLGERVHFLQNVAHNDLPGIYQQAEIFIYPSRFEGFGIPVVEALHSGVPVIAATGSCLEEAGGPDSIYVDPDNEIELADQIKSLLENDEKKTNMIRAGKLHLEKFESRKIAGQIVQLYQNVIDHA